MVIHLKVEECLRLAGDGLISGTYNGPIEGFATLKGAKTGDLSFLGNSRYRSEVVDSQASLILLPEDYEGEPQVGQIYYRVKNPSLSLGLICAELERRTLVRPEPGIHPTAFVDREAMVHEEATVGPFCLVGAGAIVGARSVLASHVHVGENARVGADCALMPHVTVANQCRIGDRVRLHSGVVVGSDGFGYEFDGDSHRKVPQIGLVEIGDDVEVGANTTIDRARFSKTRIGNGTKIDNLVQIAHNVEVGSNCIIVAQAGISGSTVIGDWVVIGGHTGVAGHLHLGSGSKVGAMSGVSKDLPENSFVRGVPAIDFHLAHKLAALQRRLPDLFKRMGDIESLLGDPAKETTIS